MDWSTVIAMVVGSVITLVAFAVGTLLGAAAAGNNKKD
jgi:ABC-type dipeptide/oligopeptide/nickel transport system permease subunit